MYKPSKTGDDKMCMANEDCEQLKLPLCERDAKSCEKEKEEGKRLWPGWSEIQFKTKHFCPRGKGLTYQPWNSKDEWGQIHYHTGAHE